MSPMSPQPARKPALSPVGKIRDYIMSFEFYATPVEQKQWLIDQIHQENIWMVGWSFSRKYFQVQGALMILETFRSIQKMQVTLLCT